MIVGSPSKDVRSAVRYLQPIDVIVQLLEVETYGVQSDTCNIAKSYIETGYSDEEKSVILDWINAALANEELETEPIYFCGGGV